ncbi:MAG TPA: hypothetical protein VFJ43_07030 [Bacteroidia bacterium]|nr:hypothetical protein [Bacteroidia bacterium]
MIKKKHILFSFIPLLVLSSAFSLLKNTSDIETIYHSRSDTAIHSFFKTWQKRSDLYRQTNKHELGKTESRINLLLTAVMDKADQNKTHILYRLVPDSVNVTFYRKWAKYPQWGYRFPSSEFSVWDDSTTLFLFHDYDSSLVAFLDADMDANRKYQGGDSATPPKISFLNNFFPVSLDKNPATYNSDYVQLEAWRKKINYNSAFAWIIETEPFVESVYIKKDFREAYVFMNRFSSTKCFYCRYKKGQWEIVVQ